MASAFKAIVEEQFKSIAMTKSVRYPRQIVFSEEFMRAIQKEYYSQLVTEDSESPVKNRPAKFLKALQFVVNDIVANEEAEKGKYKVAANVKAYDVTGKKDMSASPKVLSKNKKRVLKNNACTCDGKKLKCDCKQIVNEESDCIVGDYIYVSDTEHSDDRRIYHHYIKNRKTGVTTTVPGDSARKLTQSEIENYIKTIS